MHSQFWLHDRGPLSSIILTGLSKSNSTGFQTRNKPWNEFTPCQQSGVANYVKWWKLGKAGFLLGTFCSCALAGGTHNEKQVSITSYPLTHCTVHIGITNWNTFKVLFYYYRSIPAPTGTHNEKEAVFAVCGWLEALEALPQSNCCVLHHTQHLIRLNTGKYTIGISLYGPYL